MAGSGGVGLAVTGLIHFGVLTLPITHYPLSLTLFWLSLLLLFFKRGVGSTIIYKQTNLVNKTCIKSSRWV